MELENKTIQPEEQVPVVKRGRGRPRKEPPAEPKPKNKVGRPKVYEEGFYDNLYKRTHIDKKEYKRLLKIEQKYNELLKYINSNAL
jgi:hypothetical protein